MALKKEGFGKILWVALKSLQLVNENQKLTFILKDGGFIHRLTYISDIFDHLNQTNILFQDNNVSLFKSQGKILVSQQKINP